MSSMSRSIIRQAQRNRLNTDARKICPNCGSALKTRSGNRLYCKKCSKVFVIRSKQ